MSEYEGSLAVFQFVHVYRSQIPSTFFHAVLELVAVLHDACFDHFPHQVITFACAFSHPGKYGKTRVSLGNIINKLLNQYCFTYSRTTEQTDLTTLCIGLDEVDYLDTCEQYFRRSTEIFKFWWFVVYGATICFVGRSKTIDSITCYIEQATINLLAYWHSNCLSGIPYFGATDQAFCAVHSYCANTIFSQMLLNFEH